MKFIYPFGLLIFLFIREKIGCLSQPIKPPNLIIATEELRFLVAASLFVGFFAFLWDGVLLGLGSSNHFAIITIVGSVVGGTLLFYTYINNLGLYGLWFSLCVSLVIRSSMGFYFQKLK